MKTNLCYLLLFLGLLTTADVKAQQTRPSYIIQLEKDHSIEEVEAYFTARELQIETRFIAASIHAWLLRPTTATRRAAGWEDFLDQCPAIRIWQPNRTYSPRNREPDDPKYSEQWYLKTIGMPEAWEWTTGSVPDSFPRPVIGVLEAGITMDRPDFEDIFFSNPGEIPGNGIDDDHNGFTDDVHGWNFDDESGDHSVDPTYHGDAVIGMIAARGNNGVGISGINWSGEILPVSLEARNTDAATIRAYDYFYQMRKRYNETNGEEGGFIVATNSSFGIDGLFEEDAPLFCAMYDTLGTVGILSVGATSNQDVNVDLHGDLPSNCSSEFLIIVNSIDRNLENNSSGRGVESVDLAAPGEKVLVMGKPGEFKEDSGTSFATPQVSGIISLAYSLPVAEMREAIRENPAAVAEVVKSCILSTTTSAPDLADENKTGGYLNAPETLECVYNHYFRPDPESRALAIEQLYPNAVSDDLYVKYEVADRTQKIHYTLFDILGRKVFGGQIDPLSEETPVISVSLLPAGVFILSLKQGKHTSSKKFIKM